MFVFSKCFVRFFFFFGGGNVLHVGSVFCRAFVVSLILNAWGLAETGVCLLGGSYISLKMIFV